MRIPKLCRHKRSGRAYVTDPATGKEVYLGIYGTQEAEQEYQRWVKRYLARISEVPTGLPPRSQPTIGELVLAYLGWARKYYHKEGKVTTEVNTIEQVSRHLVDQFGRQPADEFSPGDFKAIRQILIDRGLARRHINKQMQRVRRIWKWAVEHELVEPATYHRLQAIAGLQAGRTEAKEEVEVQPVPLDVVRATLPILTDTLADMVQVQLLAGMRPGEVCIMRWKDINRFSTPWTFTPAVHKTQHRGRSRTIWLGPRSREILEKYSGIPDEQWIFQTPRRSRGSSGCYTRGSYRTAIQRTIRLHAAECGPNIPVWYPLQLRHTAATLIRSRYGLDAAQVILGHAEADTTQIYAERDAELARKVAEDVG